jgi:hypothetical protein
MNARVLAFPADPSDRPLMVAPGRFVTIKLFEALTGITESAVRMKIHRGVWLEGRQFVRRDGGVLISLDGYEKWAETGEP